MNTKVARIQLPSSSLETDITTVCNNMLAVGFRLAASFATSNEVVLIFQPATPA